MATDRTLWSVVYRHAPLLFHGTAKTVTSQRVNAITRVDFLDGWEHVSENARRAKRAPLPAWVYYDVLTGKRYLYLFGLLYHPIDKKYLPLGVGDHQQDFEWILEVFDPEQDAVIAAMTLFHDFWYFGYRKEMGVTPNVSFFNVRPLHVDKPTGRPTFHVQNGGHGIRPFNPKKPDECRLIYTPNTMTADVPFDVPWVLPNQKSVRYRLERITAAGGLWAHRNDPNVFRRVNHQARLAARRGDEIIASPATPVWCTGPAADLSPIDVGGEIRWLSRIVLDPNMILRHALKGIARDRIEANPFLV